MTLRLHPWRDGFDESTKKLLKEAPSTRTVRISFSENEFREYLQDADAIRLFEEIGSNPKFESVTIELDVFSKLPTSVAIPPIPALTSLLTAHNNKIRDLTLSQLQLESHNDLDINGMVEALRIHPTLQSIEVKNCTFTKPSHLHRLRKTLVQRQGIRHCDLLDNRISFSNREEEKIDYEQYCLQEAEYSARKKQPLWRWRWSKMCLFRFGFFILSLAAMRLLHQEPTTSRNHLSKSLSFHSFSNLLRESPPEVPVDPTLDALLTIMPWQYLSSSHHGTMKPSRRRRTPQKR